MLFFSLFLMCAFILQSPEAEVPGLVEGKDYMFRVRAVNSEGESEPLETDTATKAKNPYGERKSEREREKNYQYHKIQ